MSSQARFALKAAAAYLVVYGAILVTVGRPWSLIFSLAWLAFWVGHLVGHGHGMDVGEKIIRDVWDLDNPAVQSAIVRAQHEAKAAKVREMATWN